MSNLKLRKNNLVKTNLIQNEINLLNIVTNKNYLVSSFFFLKQPSKILHLSVCNKASVMLGDIFCERSFLISVPETYTA